MTDEQIIKALKMCTDEHIGCEDGCPCEYNGMSIARCRMEVMKDALDLINRKDAEIERLKAEIRKTDNILNSLDRPLIEVKSEAYKEFAEGFKEKASSAVTSCQGYEIYETKQYQITSNSQCDENTKFA